MKKVSITPKRCYVSGRLVDGKVSAVAFTWNVLPTGIFLLGELMIMYRN